MIQRGRVGVIKGYLYNELWDTPNEHLIKYKKYRYIMHGKALKLLYNTNKVIYKKPTLLKVEYEQNKRLDCHQNEII